MRLFLRRLQKGIVIVPRRASNIQNILLGIITLLCLSSCSNKVSIQEVKHLDRDHFKVSTSNMMLLYDVKGGGFSSIIDPNGKDWISFAMKPWDEYPASASSSFRGMPNFVFGSESSGAGHPGHDQCRSEIISSNSIRTSSVSGKWEWQWIFNDDYVIVDILSIDPHQPYWFLYEGTPGGVFDPANQFFGTSKTPKPNRSLNDYFKGDKLFDTFQWAYFGHDKSEYVLLFLQIDEDNLSDTFSYLGSTEKGVQSSDGMVVFGFGREDGAKPVLTEKNSFIIKLISIKGIDDIGQHIRSIAQELLQG